ncbi:MAG: hypothetical protein J5779_00280 [Clostridia bacterium]|nr:hypothetical protein [Clostridia bacterium]
MTKRKILSITLIGVLILAILASLIATTAYLTSRRTASGYINFSSGILVQYQNVSNSDSGSGNLFCVDNQTGENKILELNNIMPGETIKLVNPKLTAQEGTVSFALRAKLVITAETPTGNDIFDNNEEYEALTKTTAQNQSKVVFENGVIAFNDGWEYNEEDGYYYFATAGAGELADRVVEVDENSETITLFETDSNLVEYTTLTTLEGAMEKFNYDSLTFELYIDAIQYSSLDVWNLD